MVNPLLKPADYSYMLADSRARLVVLSEVAWSNFEPIVSTQPFLEHILYAGSIAPSGAVSFDQAVAASTPRVLAAPTRADEPCLWQYSSGSTGRPKGTIHLHGSIARLSEHYPRQVLSLTEDDVTFSAAKLFFGYGFGNGVIFPLATGATAVLMAGRPTAEAVWKRIVEHRATVFYGVPTLYNSMLGAEVVPTAAKLALRRCTSAGEALPAHIGRSWRERFGLDILDGIGSTEMLHIYISNMTDDVCYGATGRPIDGYGVRLMDEAGNPVAAGEVGELHIKGPTSAAGYWCNSEKNQSTFLGAWTRSGDKFLQQPDGRYVFCARSDEMLKVSGIYVSPLEVEQALLSHPDVVEAAVVGWADDAGLIKPKAFVVLGEAAKGDADMRDNLRAHVKSQLAPFKYPRWIEFIPALPRTATGKVERFKLRARQDH
jgi:benzoate-CoA ligase